MALSFRTIGLFSSSTSSLTSSSAPASARSAAHVFTNPGGVVCDISYNQRRKIPVSLHTPKLLIRHAKNLVEPAYCRTHPFPVGVRSAVRTKRRNGGLVRVEIILGSQGRTGCGQLREGHQVLRET